TRFGFALCDHAVFQIERDRVCIVAPRHGEHIAVGDRNYQVGAAHYDIHRVVTYFFSSAAPRVTLVRPTSPCFSRSRCAHRSAHSSVSRARPASYRSMTRPSVSIQVSPLPASCAYRSSTHFASRMSSSLGVKPTLWLSTTAGLRPPAPI